jgi:hypothetical protein
MRLLLARDDCQYFSVTSGDNAYGSEVRAAMIALTHYCLFWFDIFLNYANLLLSVVDWLWSGCRDNKSFFIYACVS